MSFSKPWLSVGSRLGLGSDLGARTSSVAVKETKSARGTSGVPALSHKGLCTLSCSETWPSFPGNSLNQHLLRGMGLCAVAALSNSTFATRDRGREQKV